MPISEAVDTFSQVLDEDMVMKKKPGVRYKVRGLDCTLIFQIFCVEDGDECVSHPEQPNSSTAEESTPCETGNDSTRPPKLFRNDANPAVKPLAEKTKTTIRGLVAQVSHFAGKYGKVGNIFNKYR